MRTDKVWQDPTLVNQFLTGVRGGIPFASEQIHVALRVVEVACSQVKRVADLGCGDGVLTQAILMRYPQAIVTAIDFSEPMLEQARQRLRSQSVHVEFRQADLHDSQWCEGLEPFDAVISGYCIHHLPDTRKRQLYSEIYQLIKPKGCFLNIEHVASSSPWVESLFNELLVDSLYQWHQDQGKTASKVEVAERFVYRDDKIANILAPVEVQCQWLREIGFQEVDCYFKVFELAVFGGVRY
uniref:Class I SAM-dependent methyltransferase n=1 Tax=Desertifilum tharense IPPAS B-1220 TaxID=1781255 RepID=A0ACD5GQQ3_9CYAN